MPLEGPVPTRADVVEIVRDLHKQHARPIRTTEIMEEARRRGFRGWYSAYRRRLDYLVDGKQLRLHKDGPHHGFTPGRRA